MTGAFTTVYAANLEVCLLPMSMSEGVGDLEVDDDDEEANHMDLGMMRTKTLLLMNSVLPMYIQLEV